MLNALKDYVAEKVAQISAGPKNVVAMYANHALGAVEWAEWREPDACEVFGLMRIWIQTAERERFHRETHDGPANRERARSVVISRTDVCRAIADYFAIDVPY